MEESSQQPTSEKPVAEENQTPPAASSENVRITKRGTRVHSVTGRPIAILQIAGSPKWDDDSTTEQTAATD